MSQALDPVTQNQVRQAAARLADELTLRSGARIHLRSAGATRGEEINPAVVEAMTELGVDMSEAFPKPPARVVEPAPCPT